MPPAPRDGEGGEIEIRLRWGTGMFPISTRASAPIASRQKTPTPVGTPSSGVASNATTRRSSPDLGPTS